MKIEMKSLRNMCRVMCMDRMRNEEVRRRTGVTRVTGPAEQCVEAVWTHGMDTLVGEDNSKI